MSHIQDYTQPPTFPPEKVFKTFLTPKRPGTDEDKAYTWGIAVEVKRKIDAQRLGTPNKPAGSKFLEAFKTTPLSPSKKRERQQVDERLPPASSWDRENLYAIQMYYVPTDVSTNVVPGSFIPSRQVIESRYGTVLCDNTIDESFLKDKTKIAAIQDKFLRVLFGKVHTLLCVPKERRTIADEDKPKRYSDALLRSLLEYLGVGDAGLTKLTLREEETLEVKMGNAIMVAKNEFQLVGENIYALPLYAWAEDKLFLLDTDTMFIETIAQKAAETIAFGLVNKQLTSDQAQEVFGVGLRHCYFSFWHSWMPAQYLQQLHIAPTGLGPSDFAWLKSYPVSEFGLDFCDPAQRLEIVCLLVGILDYVQSGNAKIGAYEQ